MLAAHPAPVLQFDAEHHRYYLMGQPVPSVTGVLKATGYVSFDGVPADVLERARDRGQRVHQALHYLFEGDLDEDSIDAEVRGYLDSAKRYLTRQCSGWLRVECRVFSARNAYAGTVDLVSVHKADGLISVDDFKTGDPADAAADLQTAAYQAALLEMATTDPELAEAFKGHPPRVQRRSIRLFKDGREARETLYQDPRDFTRFLNALAVTHDLQKRAVAALAWDDER